MATTPPTLPTENETTPTNNTTPPPPITFPPIISTIPTTTLPTDESKTALNPTNSTTTPPTTNNTIWPTPLMETIIDDFENPSTTTTNDLTKLTDSEILNSVRQKGQLRVLCVTWNMHGENAPSHADMQILLTPGLHHLVMVTTQECERTADKSIWNPSKAAWEAALNVAFGEQYVLVRSHGLAAIHISLLCHRAVVPLISHLDSAAIATGLGSRNKGKKIQQEDNDGNVVVLEKGGGGGIRLGNKGGVGISICFGQSSMLFVGAHLAAHKVKCARRNQDFYDIDHGLLKKLKDLPGHAYHPRNDQDNLPNVDGKTLGISAEYDHVFWGGDFNYRINGTREAIDSLIDNKLHSTLVVNDQLFIEKNRNATFSGFDEGPLHFYPTYKFDPGTDTYDTSKKKRSPSWTDRVLWRCNSKSTHPIQIIEYVSVLELKMSDHRPVRAGFEVNIDIRKKKIMKEGGAKDVKDGQNNNENEVNGDGVVLPKTIKERPIGIAESLLGEAKSQICMIQ